MRVGNMYIPYKEDIIYKTKKKICKNFKKYKNQFE